MSCPMRWRSLRTRNQGKRPRMSTAPMAGAAVMALATLPTATAETSISLGYTGDAFGAARGGLETGVRYADLLEASIEIADDSPVIGTGMTFYANGLYANGGAPSGDLFGDDQIVSNIETGFQTTRLYEAWAEIEFDKTSLLAGLYDVNGEFDVLDSAGLFLNGSYGIGLDIGQSGFNGPSIFPFTALAVRGDLDIGDNTLRIAVVDGAPGDADDPERVDFDLREDEGAFIIAEWEHKPESQSKILAGGWYHTADFEKISATGPEDSGNFGIYLRGETHILKNGQVPVRIFGRLGMANEEYNPYGTYVSAGIVADGPFSARPDDSVGLAFSYGALGDDEKDRRIADGEDPADGELNIELTYALSLTERISIQPNLQYIASPAGDSRADDTVAIGVRFSIDLTP